ncbi:MAG: hypothetical protein A4E53_03565 [Pelotomaculum sp. PtaB.Bin104]|nr:MAG: hypothetical protein A4E53_03565 [Pelotomaculum sp. PtaB.Bin104]
MIETLSRRFSESINQIEHLTLDTSKEKVLYVLESLGPDFFNINRLAYTHEELAQFAGINRVTVTRALEQIKSLPKK